MTTTEIPAEFRQQHDDALEIIRDAKPKNPTSNYWTTGRVAVWAIRRKLNISATMWAWFDYMDEADPGWMDRRHAQQPQVTV